MAVNIGADAIPFEVFPDEETDEGDGDETDDDEEDGFDELGVGALGGGGRIGARGDSGGSEADVGTWGGGCEVGGARGGRLDDAAGEGLRLGLVLHDLIIAGGGKIVKVKCEALRVWTRTW